MSKKLKVGFDLDGVILYNPARIIRPLISALKQKEIAIHRKELEFYVPQKRWEEIIWELFHKSSIFLAPGFKQIKQMRDNGLIEPYLVTGRYAHLEADFRHWKKRMNADQIFEQAVMNQQDEQPHLFKEKMIRQFKLDIFIEDNWDIVNYLDQTFNTAEDEDNKQIYWVSNFIDAQKIDYRHKFRNLKQVIAHLQSQI